MELADKVALISGSSRGIGRAIAQGLAEDGADIVINYRRDEAAATEAVQQIEALGRRAIAVQASIDSYEDDQRMVAEALEAFGKIDILVNNGGIASRGQSVADTEAAEMERVVRTHAFGAHHLSQLVVPQMRDLDRGDIVMISSVTTLSYAANGAPYAMAKAALEALAYTLAKEERPHGTHVNVVAPGLVDTDMGQRLAKAVVGAEDIHDLDAKMPYGRVCRPEDVADVVRFFVSGRGSYLTGEKLNVHGGGQEWR